MALSSILTVISGTGYTGTYIILCQYAKEIQPCVHFCVLTSNSLEHYIRTDRYVKMLKVQYVLWYWQLVVEWVPQSNFKILERAVSPVPSSSYSTLTEVARLETCNRTSATNNGKRLRKRFIRIYANEPPMWQNVKLLWIATRMWIHSNKTIKIGKRNKKKIFLNIWSCLTTRWHWPKTS